MMNEEKRELLHREVIRDSNDWSFIAKISACSLILGAVVFTLLYSLLR